MFYKLLVEEITLDNELCVKYGMNKVTPESILDLQENNYSKYIDFVGYLGGLICTVAGVSPGISITVSSVGYVASLLNSIPANKKNTIISNMKDICGYYTIQLSFDTTKTCFKKCLALKEWYNENVPVVFFGYNYDVLGYNDNDNYWRGEKNAKGSWKSM